MQNAFSTMLHDVFIVDIPTFLMSEPIIYVVGIAFCACAIGLFHKIIK